MIRRARAAGASQAEVAASIDTGLNVNVRLGEVETVEHTRDRGFGLTVYFGQRKGSASTADLHPDSIQATLDQACAIARYHRGRPGRGLADASRMASAFPDLDLWHPWDIDTTQAIELGIRDRAGRSCACRHHQFRRRQRAERARVCRCMPTRTASSGASVARGIRCRWH